MAITIIVLTRKTELYIRRTIESFQHNFNYAHSNENSPSKKASQQQQQQQQQYSITHMVKIAMGDTLGLGLVKRTSSFGRKRILILNHMDFDTIDATTTKIQQFSDDNNSLLEALPQEILIKILCGVDHDDLKSLFHVSKPIREAALIAKKWHFEYSTPKKFPAFRCSLNLEESLSSEFKEIEAPNAPKRSRIFRSRWIEKDSADICVSLFAFSSIDKA
ncbi:F-box protein At4g05010-like [Rutidosis leptorrhynchoides]|uniref:F-box protein At4g05010-like n=1 Tax=Rutidosis leptorrhynchoides TaxID=125765 RepID=UPI003A98FFAA